MSQSSPSAAGTRFHPHLRNGRSRSAVIGVLWSSLHTLIPVASATLVFFVSALYLTPAELGQFGLASSLVMSVVALSPIAFGEALVQRQDITRADADSVFWMAMAAGGLLTAPFLLSAAALADWTGEAAIAGLLPLLALRIPLDLAAAVPNAMIVRSMRFKAVAVRTAVATALTVVVTLGMLRAGYGVWALAVSQVTGSLAVCAMAFRASGWRPGLQLDAGALRSLMGYGLFSSGTRMLTTMRLDHIVLGALGGTALLGLYFFAQKFYMMLTQLVAGALSSVTHALLSTLQGDRAKTLRAFGIASFAAATVSFPTFALLALLAPEAMALVFDARWREAGGAVQLFCILGAVAGVSVVQGALIRSQGRADWWFWYQFVQQASSVLVIGFAFRAGLDTLMVALVVKSLLVWPVSVAMTTRLLGIGPLGYLRAFAAPALATAAMAAVVLGLPHVLSGPDPLAELVLRCCAAVLAYGATLALLAHRRIREMLHILATTKETAL